MASWVGRGCGLPEVGGEVPPGPGGEGEGRAVAVGGVADEYRAGSSAPPSGPGGTAPGGVGGLPGEPRIGQYGRDPECGGTNRRYYDEMWNCWNFVVADKLISESIRFRGALGMTVNGRDGFKEYMRTVQRAFPDFNNKIEELIGSCCRATYPIYLVQRRH